MAAPWAPKRTRVHEFSALGVAGFASVGRNRNVQPAPP